MKNSKENFKNIKNLSEKYITWNDLQKSDENCKSSIWKSIKIFRSGKLNKPYQFREFNGQKICVGWCFGEVNCLF